MSSELKSVVNLPHLSPRPADGHKGTFGKVLVVAGSRGMTGAAIMTGSAALRGGAGLVRVAAPRELLPVVAGGNPCYTTAALPGDDQGRLAATAATEIVALAKENDVLAVGPGLGQSPQVSEVLSVLLEKIQIPIVLDADGLNALAGNADLLGRRSMPLIITPHPGEFGRLAGKDIRAVQANRTELAVEFARRHGLVVVLKGSGTIVTDGKQIYRNRTGNPGMASGGTGDVLTGLIAALVGQGLQPFAAAQLGVYLHGLAGDLSSLTVGQVSLIATDLLEHLPAAFQQL